jgi:sugar phosphate isomerase/epimerase
MRIGVMSYSYASAIAAGAMDTAGAIRHAASLGVDAIELMDRLIDEREAPAIRAALAETGSMVVGYDLADDVVLPDATARRAAVERLRRGLERAAAIGAPRVLLFAGSLKPDLTPEAARGWLAEGLRECVVTARSLELTPTIENLGVEAVLCGTSDHLLALAEAVGGDLRVTYDAGNFLLAGEDELAALPRLWRFVDHVHLKDWAVAPVPTAGVYVGVDGRRFRGVALGEGLVQLSGVLDALQRAGYAGTVTVEYEGLGEPRQAVERGVRYVRAWLESRAEGPRP